MTLEKIVYTLVKALIDSGALALLRQAMQEKLTEPSKPNEDDSAFIDDAHNDGWSE